MNKEKDFNVSNYVVERVFLGKFVLKDIIEECVVKNEILFDGLTSDVDTRYNTNISI